MRAAFLFPGQGAQAAGFLRRLPEHPRVHETLAEAAQCLGRPVHELDDAQALRQTQSVQLGLLIAGVAQARALRAEGAHPDVVAGMSVGAFGAAVACGCLEFADALRLVRMRAQSMQRACGEGFGMLAVSGLREPALRELLQQLQGAAMPGESAWLANLNADAQFVVAGTEALLQRLLDAARDAGARKAERLDVAVASHGPALAATAAELADALRSLRLRDAELPYVANTTARVLRAAPDIARDLAEGVMRPVLWHDTNRLLLERGVACFVEMPPGQTLTRMVHNLSCRVEALASDGASLRSLVVRVRRAQAQG